MEFFNGSDPRYFFNGGQVFGNPDTILPVFLQHFTSSKILVGLTSTLLGSLGGIGNVLPQLFVASKLETKIQKKPVLRAAITIHALCWGGLALTTFIFAEKYPNLTVFFLFLFLLLFTIMGCVASIPFYDIWSKALPPTLWGRFFGHRQFWGGILAAGSGKTNFLADPLSKTTALPLWLKRFSPLKQSVRY